MGRPPVDADVVRRVAARLAAAGVPTPEVDARLLVEHVVEVTSGSGSGTGAGAAAGCGGALLDGLVERRAARVPLQQVIGRTWFRTLELTCAPGVFVPRPETEIVAGVAIDAALAAGRERARVVDVGTGSGAIACAVAAEVPGVDVVAVDRDPLAVALAGVNAERVRTGTAVRGGPAPGATVTVVRGSLLEPVPPAWHGRLDVLVSNPPYLPAGDRGSWAPEVGAHDPDHALVGGPDGHELVDRLLEAAATWLRPGGTVVVEIDDRRGADAMAAAEAAGLAQARLVPDLTGRDRAVVAVRPG